MREFEGTYIVCRATRITNGAAWPQHRNAGWWVSAHKPTRTFSDVGLKCDNRRKYILANNLRDPAQRTPTLMHVRHDRCRMRALLYFGDVYYIDHVSIYSIYVSISLDTRDRCLCVSGWYQRLIDVGCICQYVWWCVRDVHLDVDMASQSGMYQHRKVLFGVHGPGDLWGGWGCFWV